MSAEEAAGVADRYYKLNIPKEKIKLVNTVHGLENLSQLIFSVSCLLFELTKIKTILSLI